MSFSERAAEEDDQTPTQHGFLHNTQLNLNSIGDAQDSQEGVIEMQRQLKMAEMKEQMAEKIKESLPVAASKAMEQIKSTKTPTTIAPGTSNL